MVLPDSVALSTAVSDGGESIRTAPGTGPIALVIDTDRMTPADCHGILYAIKDSHDRGRDVVAVMGDANGAAGVIVLACQGIALVDGATLTGADDEWCKSPSQVSAMAGMLVAVGSVDSTLAERVMGGQSVLSWSAKDGYSVGSAGEVTIAMRGKPVSLDEEELRKTGLGEGAFMSEDEAVNAVSNGSVRTRSASAGGSAPPPGSPGLGGSSGGPGAPPAAATAAPATGPWGLPEDLAKIVEPKLDEYKATLSALKLELDEFLKYYDGRKGNWDSSHRSLQKVWADGANMTRDPDTKLTVQRLQASMREKLTALERTTKWVSLRVKDKTNPLVKQLDSNLEAIKGLRDAFARNKCSLFDANQPLIKTMTVK
ncbi:MAG: hypothetical protein O2855_07910 [Planctomycetota bacterium]|nr:hypothetical protein [Planctomycetota bacterium]